MLTGCDADLICVGHTHWPTERVLDGVHVVNVGSVSNPQAADLRASYAMLTATEAGYKVDFHRVEYDCDAVIEAVQRSRNPGGEYIIRHFRGEQRPWWESRPSPDA